MSVTTLQRLSEFGTSAGVPAKDTAPDLPGAPADGVKRCSSRRTRACKLLKCSLCSLVLSSCCVCPPVVCRSRRCCLCRRLCVVLVSSPLMCPSMLLCRTVWLKFLVNKKKKKSLGLSFTPYSKADCPSNKAFKTESVSSPAVIGGAGIRSIDASVPAKKSDTFCRSLCNCGVHPE